MILRNDQQKSIEGNDAMTSSHLIDTEQLLADPTRTGEPGSAARAALDVHRRLDGG
ncbi:IS1081, transposase [Mycobacterium tuberculosis variant bovis BCG str. ATCC 35743]|nr:IS1081, transposase [Mycobacterium tuberculosis variant bovis BCG str. ATCC 35743]